MTAKNIEKLIVEEIEYYKEKVCSAKKQADDFYNSGKVIDAESEMDYYAGYLGRYQHFEGHLHEAEYLLECIKK